MVDQFVDGLRNDSPGAQRHETRRQQTERPYEESHRHQQEEQFRISAGIDGVVPAHVPCDDSHIDGTDDLGEMV